MFSESIQPDYEAELSDELFDEVFEDEYHDIFSDNYSSDNIYFDDAHNSDVNSNLELLTSEIQELSAEDAYEQATEAFPALIPLIKVLAPAVISAATTLAPMAVKAVGGLLGKKSRSTSVPRLSNPSVAQVQPNNQKQLQRQGRCSCGANTAASNLGQGALNTLANLLGNPDVQNVLNNLANKGISQAIKLGNSESLAREGALLNAISYLAQEAQNETFDDQYPDSYEYLEGFDGDFVANPNSLENAALRFIELYNS